MNSKENIKKISRLLYVVILIILSYSMFWGGRSNNKLYLGVVGEPTSKFLTKAITKEYFLSCLKDKYRKNPYQKECLGTRKLLININGLLISPKIGEPNAYNRPKESAALQKFNKDPKRKYYYAVYDDVSFVRYDAQRYTNLIMWGLFILSIPLIWFSRNFSITIVNSIASLVSKGWKKL